LGLPALLLPSGLLIYSL